MKQIIKIFFFLSLMFLNSNLSSQNLTECKNNKIKLHYYFNEYQIQESDVYLDSTMLFIDLAIRTCPNDYYILTMSKLTVYSLQRNYNDAIKYITNINDSVFEEMPLKKSILLNRFLAMKYSYIGNDSLKKIYISLIINEIMPISPQEQAQIDSLCILPELSDILSNPLFHRLVQYYYYYSIVEDPQKISAELDSFISKGYNKEYIEFIKDICKDDFLTFNYL